MLAIGQATGSRAQEGLSQGVEDVSMYMDQSVSFSAPAPYIRVITSRRRIPYEGLASDPLSRTISTRLHLPLMATPMSLIETTYGSRTEWLIWSFFRIRKSWM